MYDLIIIGGGPAGITAAATALNQRLETLIIAERWERNRAAIQKTQGCYRFRDDQDMFQLLE